MRTLLSRIALLVLVALVATACRADAELAERAPAANPTPAAPATPAPATPAPATPAPATPQAEPFDQAPPQVADLPAEWDEPLALDSEVIEGTLSNGLNYLIRRNLRPGDQAQLRLVVHAGSLNEVEGTDGLAHFLEHMMFNGTEQFPGNEIVQVLESFGSAFGPDVNAYTSFEETVYELQVPTRSLVPVQLGLDVLRQWASAATIAEADVVAERGVVREELRGRTETVGARIGQAVRDVLFTGTEFLNNEAIGEAEVVEAMSAGELRAFYEAWYRPELMTVIAVGDFDLSDMEQRIVDTFDQPVSADPAQPIVIEPGSPLPEPIFDVLTDAEIQRPEVQVFWRLPRDVTMSRSGLHQAVVGSVAMAMLNARLFERVQGGEGVLLNASASSGGFTNTTQIASLSGRPRSDQALEGLSELLTEVERARQFGFTQDELDRVMSDLRASAEQQFSESATRQDADLADELVEYALGRAVLTASDVERAASLEVFDSITVEDATAFLFELLETDPYVLLTAPADVEAALPTPEGLGEVYFATVGTVVDSQERVASDVTELMQRPEPAEIVDRQQLSGLNTTVVTYENGARLAFRQTSITENVVQLRGTSQGGFFASDVALLDRAASLVGGSGFESVDIITVDRLLAGKIASLNTSIGRATESISGQSSTEDLETMMQLLYLQVTEPTITDLEVRQFDERWRPLAENPEASPAIAADLELWQLRYGDSPWFRLIPDAEDLDALEPDALLAAYRERFENAGDFVFSVVGDFDPDQLIELGASYLGTLPDNGVREGPLDRDPGVPEENLTATVAAGVGDQGQVRINWESPYPFTLEAAVTAEALEIVVDARLRDLIREQLSASYAPSAAVSVLSEPKSWVDTIIEVESDPERVEEVSETVRAELERIRAGEFEQRYLDGAIEQLVEGYRFFSNNEWLDLIEFHIRYPDRPAAEYQARSDIAQRLSITDIAEAAAVVFPASRSVEVRLVPAGAG